MLTGSYSIEELSEETGFDKRVIRSFIEQGLLRGPESKGRYARYTHGHLIRLKAIRQLRDNRQMTLGEIRAALLSMTDEDIHSLSIHNAAQQAKGARLSSSVLDYLRAARHQSFDTDPLSAEAEAGMNKVPALQRPQSALDRLAQVLQDEAGARRLTAHGKGQLWHRFAVTPDIELTIRGLQDGGQVEQWEKIADCLREILLGGSNKNEQ